MKTFRPLRCMGMVVRRSWKRLLPIGLLLAAQSFSLSAQAQNGNYAPWTHEEKMYAFSKFWAEVKRNYVYMYKVGVDRWDSLYRALLPQVMDNPYDGDFIRLMERFCAFLEDGHTGISYDWRHGMNVTANYYRDGVSLWIDLVENKLTLVSVDSLHARELPPGSELVEIGGMSAWDYLKEKSLPYISASTPHVRMETAARLLLKAPVDRMRTMTFRVGKELKTVRLVNCYQGPYSPQVSLPGVDWWRRNTKFEFSWPEKDIAYVRIGTLSEDEVVERFDSIFPELRKRAKGVIIDLRNNGGGSTGRGTHILSHFTPKNHLEGSRWFTRCYKPAYASWGAKSPSKPDGILPADTVGNAYNKECYLQFHDLAMYDGGTMKADFAKDHPYIEVPVAVLTNSHTVSACEDFLIFADQVPNVFQVGEPTNGSTGNPIFIDLIPGLSCRICTKKDTYPDGREFVGKGIEPDVYVPVTLESLQENEDIQLDAALKEIRKRMH